MRKNATNFEYSKASSDSKYLPNIVLQHIFHFLRPSTIATTLRYKQFKLKYLHGNCADEVMRNFACMSLHSPKPVRIQWPLRLLQYITDASPGSGDVNHPPCGAVF